MGDVPGVDPHEKWEGAQDIKGFPEHGHAWSGRVGEEPVTFPANSRENGILQIACFEEREHTEETNNKDWYAESKEERKKKKREWKKWQKYEDDSKLRRRRRIPLQL